MNKRTEVSVTFLPEEVYALLKTLEDDSHSVKELEYQPECNRCRAAKKMADALAATAGKGKE